MDGERTPQQTPKNKGTPDDDGPEHTKTMAATNQQTANTTDIAAPPPAIPYAVGIPVKILRVKTIDSYGWYNIDSAYTASCWCPATIRSYNATTSRYTIEYDTLSKQRKKRMTMKRETLEHNEINTEPFPLEPRYPCGFLRRRNQPGSIA